MGWPPRQPYASMERIIKGARTCIGMDDFGLLGSTDPEYLRAALGAFALGCGLTIFHGNLLGVLHLYLLLALHTIGFDHYSASSKMICILHEDILCGVPGWLGEQ